MKEIHEGCSVKITAIEGIAYLNFKVGTIVYPLKQVGHSDGWYCRCPDGVNHYIPVKNMKIYRTKEEIEVLKSYAQRAFTCKKFDL